MMRKPGTKIRREREKKPRDNKKLKQKKNKIKQEIKISNKSRRNRI